MRAVRIKRVYEAAESSDGQRILVDGLWPRGISKADAALADWHRDVAPSAALRKWFGHEPARWPEFLARYHAELDARREVVEALIAVIDRAPTTLVYSAKDEAHNNAVALAQYLRT